MVSSPVVPARRVAVVPDTCSALFLLRCVEPCADARRLRRPVGCQESLPPARDPRLAPRDPGLCWLGSAATMEGAILYAAGLGYEVVPAQAGRAA